MGSAVDDPAELALAQGGRRHETLTELVRDGPVDLRVARAVQLERGTTMRATSPPTLPYYLKQYRACKTYRTYFSPGGLDVRQNTERDDG